MKKIFNYAISILCLSSMIIFVGCGNNLPQTDGGMEQNAPINKNPNENAVMQSGSDQGYDEDKYAECENRMNELLMEGYSCEGLKAKLVEEGYEMGHSVVSYSYSNIDWVEQAKIFVNNRINKTGYSVAMLRTELADAKFNENDIDQALWSSDVDYKNEACLAAVTISKDESYPHHRKSIREELEYTYDFKIEEIDYAMENAAIDWKAVATRFITSLDSPSNEVNHNSRLSLENCVSDGQLLLDEIQYGISQLDVDWNKRAAKYLDMMHLVNGESKNFLREELRNQKFTNEEIEQGLLLCNYDWEEHVVSFVMACGILSFDNIEEIKQTVRDAGYNEVEVGYAAERFKDIF